VPAAIGALDTSGAAVVTSPGALGQGGQTDSGAGIADASATSTPNFLATSTMTLSFVLVGNPGDSLALISSPSPGRTANQGLNHMGGYGFAYGGWTSPYAGQAASGILAEILSSLSSNTTVLSSSPSPSATTVGTTAGTAASGAATAGAAGATSIITTAFTSGASNSFVVVVIAVGSNRYFVVLSQPDQTLEPRVTPETTTLEHLAAFPALDTNSVLTILSHFGQGPLFEDPISLVHVDEPEGMAFNSLFDIVLPYRQEQAPAAKAAADVPQAALHPLFIPMPGGQGLPAFSLLAVPGWDRSSEPMSPGEASGAELPTVPAPLTPAPSASTEDQPMTRVSVAAAVAGAGFWIAVKDFRRRQISFPSRAIPASRKSFRPRQLTSMAR
jgi:hypothetical protein